MRKNRKSSFIVADQSGSIAPRQKEGLIEKARLKLLGRRTEFEVRGGHRKTTAYVYTRSWVDFGLFLRYRMGEGNVLEWSNRGKEYRAGITPFALAFLEENIGEVQTEDVDAYVTALLNLPVHSKGKVKIGLSGSTVNTRLASIAFLIKIAMREKDSGIESNCASSDMIDRRKMKRRQRPFRLEAEDVRALIAYLDKFDGFIARRNAAMIRFLYSTGCRRDELVRLTVDDLISLPRHKGVAITLSRKGDHRQDIILSSELEASFVEYVNIVQPESYIFPRGTMHGNSTNLPLSPDRVTKIMRSLTSEVLGRCHSPHDFRHAFCTEALRNGAPLHSVQQYLGHSDPQTTMFYFDSVLERDGSAAEFVSLSEVDQ